MKIKAQACCGTKLCCVLPWKLERVGEQGKKVSLSVKECSVLTKVAPQILALFRETLEHVAGHYMFCLTCP